jgi:hypothetical protein
MIPNNPINCVATPEESAFRRRVLFNLGRWEIVLYKNYQRAYTVHSCRGNIPDQEGVWRSSPPRAITTYPVTPSHETSSTCWSCGDTIPDEIITITELYNAR